MKFLTRLLKMIPKTNSLFGSNLYEMHTFICGIGEVEIEKNYINIKKYPFEPSLVYPSKKVLYSEIDEIHLGQYPPTLKIGNELIFISREQVKLLEGFALRNKVKTTERASNWDWITEPFLDTEFDEEQQEKTQKLLEANGIFRDELKQLREEIGKQMYKYNFDTMLWEWVNLGLNDVLAAMRPKLSKDFYWRAMEIEQRCVKNASIHKK